MDNKLLQQSLQLALRVVTERELDLTRMRAKYHNLQNDLSVAANYLKSNVKSENELGKKMLKDLSDTCNGLND